MPRPLSPCAVLAALAAAIAASTAAAQRELPSEWRFNGNLDNAIGGPAVIRWLDDTRFSDNGNICTRGLNLPIEGLSQQLFRFGTTESFGLPAVAGRTDTVLRIHPARDPQNNQPHDGLGIVLWPGSGPECNAELWHFTLAWDLLIPSDSWQPGNYFALFNDNDNNENGMDAWIIINDQNQAGIRYRDDEVLFTDLIRPDTWVRIIISCQPDNDVASPVYINGTYIGDTRNDWIYNSVDPNDPRFADEDCDFYDFRTQVPQDVWMRWGMFPNPFAHSGNCGGGYPAELETTATFFSDNAGRGEVFYVANMYWNERDLTADEALALGGPNADGFIKGGQDCPIDYDGNGQADGGDFLAFLGYFFSGDNRADLDGNNIIDGADFLTFLALFFSDDCQP